MDPVGFQTPSVHHIAEADQADGVWWLTCTGCRFDAGPYESRGEALGGWADHVACHPGAQPLERRKDGSVQVVAGYVITRPTDFSEGRSFERDTTLWVSEQDAWDQVNDLRGVQGAHPSTWNPSRGRYDNWQAAHAAGVWTDYTVSPVHAIVHPGPTQAPGDQG